MNHFPFSKTNLKTLYSSGKSLQDISTHLRCSVHKVIYWMRKYGIVRRSRSDAMYVKLNPNGDPFKIKKSFSRKDLFLFGLGLGIYWGEGTKASQHAVRVSNSDPNMVKSFIRFLENICGVRRAKMRYSIVCFNDSNPAEVAFFWAQALGIRSNQFGKIVQVPPQGKGNYRRKSETGVCTVTVSNIKLKSWIMERLKELSEGRLDSLVVKQTLGKG